MVWKEVLTAQKENRHEIVLSGDEISKRITKSGFDLTIFDLTGLNYLNIHETCLSTIPDEIERLANLQTVVLHSNKIKKFNVNLTTLGKMKVLDLSRNCLKSVPGDMNNLLQLTTLNLANNQLGSSPALKNPKLTVLDLSNNKLNEFPDVCHCETNLSELKLSGNEIEALPASINKLGALKVFHLNGNKVKVIPGELSDCSKLKDLNLKENPLSDKRLAKLIVQCHMKQVIDYIKQHCPRTTAADKASKQRKKSESQAEGSTQPKDLKAKLVIKRFTDTLKVVIDEEVATVRAHLVVCAVLNVEFNEENFKKFIQLQNKLHDTVCDKRNSATIATHDLKKLGEGDLAYTVLPPNSLTIKPLHRTQPMTGVQLFAKLQAEADNLRKEKKRNVYSGIHKYLYLLEGKPKYPCLLNSIGEVVSFPPITNSDTTKMTVDTRSFLIEVTSATSKHVCKKVAEALLKDMLPLFGNEAVIQQVMVVDKSGNLKSVFPSRSDLSFDDVSVEREATLNKLET